MDCPKISFMVTNRTICTINTFVLKMSHLFRIRLQNFAQSNDNFIEIFPQKMKKKISVLRNVTKCLYRLHIPEHFRRLGNEIYLPQKLGHV